MEKVHLKWSYGVLHCSIFKPRLGMNLTRLCAKSCQNVMVSHGKSWQDLANIFLRAFRIDPMCTESQIHPSSLDDL